MTDSTDPNELVVPIEEDARIGCRLGNLEIVDRIGIGGMGAVYRAVHKVLETPYAVKVLHPRFSEDPEAVDRFRAEAIATSRLRHPNVVFVTDARDTPGLSASLRGLEPLLAIGVALLFVSSGVVRGGFVRWSFLPRIDSDVITVSTELPFLKVRLG